MSKSIVNLIIGLIYTAIITAIVFAVIYGKTLVIWCINGIKLPNLKLFSVNSGTLVKILLAIAIVAIVGFIFKKLKKKGPKKAGSMNKPTSGKLSGKLLDNKVIVFVALAITAYAFFYFGILAKLAKVLDIKILGAHIPFIREILTLMICVFIIGFITKMEIIVRDKLKGIYRIFFPFVDQISFAILFWVGSFLITLIMFKIGANYIESYFRINNVLVISIATTAWLFLNKFTLKWFFVSVPAFVGLVTLSYLGGEKYVYSSGIHIKYPWESSTVDDYYYLGLITIPFAEDFVSKDGAVVKGKGSFRYYPDINNLITYASIDESTIAIGFTDTMKRLLTVEISQRMAIQARTETEQIKQKIDSRYNNPDGTVKDAPDEKKFGVQFEGFTLADIGYDERTQNILVSEFDATSIAANEKFVNMGSEARTDSMILRGTIPKEIKTIEIKGLEGVSGALAVGAAGLLKLLEKITTKGDDSGNTKG